MAWPEPVERVAVFLRAAGAESRLEELASDTPSAQAAAEAVGCALDQIVKSLVFVCGDAAGAGARPGRPPCRPGEDRGSRSARPRRALRGRPRSWPRRASRPARSRPSRLLPACPILIERTILSSAVVWVGAGSERHLAMVSPLELVRLTRGTTVDIVQE